MIIKSTTRKDRNFRQLVHYLCSENSGMGIEFDFCYLHNVDEKHRDNLDDIAKSFSENDKYRKKRKNGVVMYHEILAFSPDDTPALKKNPHILQDLARRYIEERSPNGMCIAKCHFDKGHWHIHFMISGSEYKSNKISGVSKKAFAQIKKTLQEYQREQYPELEKSFDPMRDKNALEKTCDPNVAKKEVKQHNKKIDKELVSHAVEEALSHTETKKKFIDFLKRRQMPCYTRGNRIYGVLFNNRKYRFSTILKGSMDDLERLSSLLGNEKQYNLPNPSEWKKVLHQNAKRRENNKKKDLRNDRNTSC